MRVTRREIEAIAAYLEMDVDEFVRLCTRVTSDRRGLSLIENPDGSCLFLRPDNRCDINPVKPRQCRDFPNGWNFPGFDDLCQAVKVPVDPTEKERTQPPS